VAASAAGVPSVASRISGRSNVNMPCPRSGAVWPRANLAAVELIVASGTQWFVVTHIEYGGVRVPFCPALP
jgi:hypothetical protein